MNIVYLWRYRERPHIFTKRWFVVWVKRLIHGLRLFKSELRRYVANYKGASISSLSVFDTKIVKGEWSNLSVGIHSKVAFNAALTLRAKLSIGNSVVISEGVQIFTGSHDLKDADWKMYQKDITIDDYVWIATNAILLPGVRIGRGAVVGAGAVVRKNVLDGEIVIGNPAVVIGNRDHKNLRYSPALFTAEYEAWLGKPSSNPQYYEIFSINK